MVYSKPLIRHRRYATSFGHACGYIIGARRAAVQGPPSYRDDAGDGVGDRVPRQGPLLC